MKRHAPTLLYLLPLVVALLSVLTLSQEPLSLCQALPG